MSAMDAERRSAIRSGGKAVAAEVEKATIGSWVEEERRAWQVERCSIRRSPGSVQSLSLVVRVQASKPDRLDLFASRSTRPTALDVVRYEVALFATAFVRSARQTLLDSFDEGRRIRSS